MSLSGVREMSLITTPPPSRRPIQTHLSSYNSDVIRMDHFILTTPLFKLDLKRVRLFSKLTALPTCADKPARFVCENRL